ncbi:MAG: histidine phosphatase family protein [Bacteriovoracaceae bacterium]|nr:histidine phosphatase family protein [Bacteriovoracaceae bacterium]
MNLWLTRHGNTFNPQDQVVRVGAKEDLPLTPQGFKQAEHLAQYFLQQKIIFSHCYTGPLKRAKNFGEHILKTMNYSLPVQIDARLNELDYGDWGGLPDSEIQKRWPTDFFAWEESSKWPVQGKWGEGEAEVRKRVHHFFLELKKKYNSQEHILVVSSNGLLRYFLTLVQGEFESRVRLKKLKMRTGAIGQIKVHQEIPHLTMWDFRP